VAYRRCGKIGKAAEAAGLTRWAVIHWERHDIFSFNRRLEVAHQDYCERWELVLAEVARRKAATVVGSPEEQLERLRANEERIQARVAATMAQQKPESRIKHWLKVAAVVGVVIWLGLALVHSTKSCGDFATDAVAEAREAGHTEAYLEGVYARTMTDCSEARYESRTADQWPE
jgi:hypothetical protein